MRILGLDYGSKTVGVAVSDALGLTAQGLETIVRKRKQTAPDLCQDRSADFRISDYSCGFGVS